MSTPEQRWNAGLYDARHAFVWKHGASLLELLAPRPEERILDLGCGTAHLTVQIATTGARVVGLDHSAEMLEQARAAYPQLELVQADARHFAFDEPFDAVFSNAALHWVTEPAPVIACIRPALRVGGRFVAEFGGRGNVLAVREAMRRAGERLGLALPEPAWYFPGIGDYAPLLEQAGLEVRFATLFDRPTPLDGPAGLRDWVRVFGHRELQQIPVARQEEFFAAVEEVARPTLHGVDGWFADYRRLRVVAVRLS